MDRDWAEENLKVIRTLMERAAVYRRALAPTTLLVGGIGIVGAIVGHFLETSTPGAFSVYWTAVALIALAGAGIVVRLQAVRAGEPFWSPPTKRVAQAVAPALSCGVVAGVVGGLGFALAPVLIAAGWMMFFGCAIVSAGFFMPRGIKLFGYLFCALGAFLAAATGLVDASSPWVDSSLAGHLAMGAGFGALHVVYGVYLLCTESRSEIAS
jgi:hypothetical protein